MSTLSLRARVASEIRAELGRQRRSASWLGRETGLGQTAVSRRLSGDIALDLDDLEKIAGALDVPVTTFLPAQGGEPMTSR